VRTRGPARRRAVDLAIAATANVHRVSLLTHTVSDFALVVDVVDAPYPWAASCRAS
jgi:predicted nucleic acid-binding protein